MLPFFTLLLPRQLPPPWLPERRQSFCLRCIKLISIPKTM